MKNAVAPETTDDPKTTTNVLKKPACFTVDADAFCGFVKRFGYSANSVDGRDGGTKNCRMDKISFRDKFKRWFKYFLISFGALFLLRLIYGYITPDAGMETRTTADYAAFAGNNDGSQQNSLDNNVNLRKNYASEKKKAYVGGQPVLQVKEKYEKIGSLTSISRDFENDEKKMRGTITEFKAIIQSEQATGLAGHRMLRLSIGVDPEKFDALIEATRKIGELSDIQITKTDKTNDYKSLNAKRISQEKYRNSLIALKKHSGKVTEMIELENKILEIEKEIQDLGVKLGDFDEQNEFCTVRFALAENRSAVKTGFFKNLLRRVKAAFEWTVQYYLMAAFLILIASLGILVILLIAERLGFIRQLLAKYTDEAPATKSRGRKA